MKITKKKRTTIATGVAHVRNYTYLYELFEQLMSHEPVRLEFIGHSY